MKTLNELILTHKQCSTCKAYKLFNSFHRCDQAKDKLMYSCKECVSARSGVYNETTRSNPEKHKREKELKRILYSSNVKNPEFVEKYKKKSKDRLISKEQARIYQYNHISKNPDKIRARNLAMKAIRRGDIVRLPCEVCGDELSEAHHDDYSKPLQVRFLCKIHHMEHHRKYDYK